MKRRLPKPYYQDEFATIYHGDCRQILPSLGPVDLVLTDPPYGISLPTDFTRRRRDQLSKCRDYPAVHGDSEPFDPTPFLAYPRVALWGANYYADKLPPVSGWLVWDKKRPERLDQATCELAWTNCVKGARVFRHLWHGMMRASERGTGYHPTQKPVALMAWCLEWMKAQPGETVIDSYMGCGPVLVAAKGKRIYSIGIEIEEQYCQTAAERLASMYPGFGL